MKRQQLLKKNLLLAMVVSTVMLTGCESKQDGAIPIDKARIIQQPELESNFINIVSKASVHKDIVSRDYNLEPYKLIIEQFEETKEEIRYTEPDDFVEPEHEVPEETIPETSQVEPQTVAENIVETQPQASTQCYTDEELYIMSHVIFGEAGGYTKELQIAVGSVVLNRMNDPRFPNTIKEVVFQEGQYACTWDGNYDRQPDQQSINVAKFLLENGSQIPSNVIFQAEFLQGVGTWKKIGIMYFCY